MRHLIVLALAFVVLASTGCGKDTVVLLPNPDGSVGAVVVTPRAGGGVDLTQANQAVGVSSKTQAETTYTMSDEQIERTFGDALAAEPVPVEKFMLYFDTDSTALKPESVPLLEDIMKAVAARKSSDVSVIGHTDRLGDKDYNMSLSLRRANEVAKLLFQMGLDKEIVEINSHGENNPIVPTADGVSSRLNRRVQVTVR